MAAWGNGNKGRGGGDAARARGGSGAKGSLTWQAAAVVISNSEPFLSHRRAGVAARRLAVRGLVSPAGAVAARARRLDIAVGRGVLACATVAHRAGGGATPPAALAAAAAVSAAGPTGRAEARVEELPSAGERGRGPALPGYDTERRIAFAMDDRRAPLELLEGGGVPITPPIIPRPRRPKWTRQRPQSRLPRLGRSGRSGRTSRCLGGGEEDRRDHEEGSPA